MGDHGHNRHGPKRGLLCSFRGELGPRLIQCGLGRGLLPYQVVSASIQPFGHNRHELKTGGCAPFRGELRPPSNTTSPAPMFTSIPSAILIKVRTDSSIEFGSNPILLDLIRIESAAGSNLILIVYICAALDHAVD